MYGTAMTSYEITVTRAGRSERLVVRVDAPTPTDAIGHVESTLGELDGAEVRPATTLPPMHRV